MIDLNTVIAQDVAAAIDEDIGSGDITAALIPKHIQAHATLITREPMVLCGRPWFDASFAAIDPEIAIDWQQEEGKHCNANSTLCTLTGSARHILTTERTAMNFLQTLSATATTTKRYVDALRGSQTKILDTRKTIPGLRRAQKYATQTGGAQNHRIGLYDAYLIKENHIAACGSIHNAVAAARSAHPQKPVEVEVENLDELAQALKAGCDQILLDNFSLEEIHAAVSSAAGKATLEISGNVTLETIGDYAHTGVDYISVGALTKHIQAIDLSLRLQTQGKQ